jgi:hypothetical protein
MSAEDLQRRNLRTLALLAGLFLLPLVLAFFTYYGTAWRPAGRVNHGQLFTPARPLPAVALPRIPLETPAAAKTQPALRGKWSLVYAGEGGCDSACRQALYVMRQTKLALGNDMTRLAPVFLVTGGCCAHDFLARQDAGLVVLDAGAPAAEPLLRELSGHERAYTLYIVDPLGNLVMSYDARADPHGLLEDLQKLLRLSHIG